MTKDVVPDVNGFLVRLVFVFKNLTRVQLIPEMKGLRVECFPGTSSFDEFIAGIDGRKNRPRADGAAIVKRLLEMADMTGSENEGHFRIKVVDQIREVTIRKMPDDVIELNLSLTKQEKT